MLPQGYIAPYRLDLSVLFRAFGCRPSFGLRGPSRYGFGCGTGWRGELQMVGQRASPASRALSGAENGGMPYRKESDRGSQIPPAKPWA